MQSDYEEYSERQLKILEGFVSNTNGNVFVLRNLPEVIKGALFSRYSRSSLGLRDLLLKDFILNEETAFDSIVGASTSGDVQESDSQVVAIKKAQNFYDRILDGYGDDSIGELGGAHLAIENVSMLGAKVIEDCRVGGSPLEKSTRYIFFDQKVNGEYLFYKEPILMTSAYRDLYLDTCNRLFETYGRLAKPLSAHFEQKFPRESGQSKVAYTAALRAKVLDCLRGLLPSGALTNMGIYGNGRFFESLIRRLHSQNLAECQELGGSIFDELETVIPSFIRRASLQHKNHQDFAQFQESINSRLKAESEKFTQSKSTSTDEVRLIYHDPDAGARVAGGLLFPYSDNSLESLCEMAKGLGAEERASILEAACVDRSNRRHKSPRALELATFTFEIEADFGIYRDLQRHRMLSQNRQLLSCDHGYYTPPEIKECGLGEEYDQVLREAKGAYETIAAEFPEEAQYVVPMAYKIRWYFHVNLRTLQWMCELRSAAAGHPGYRHVAQEMARQVAIACPEFERFFAFVDYEGYDLGRMGQEQRKADKEQSKPDSPSEHG